MLGMSEAHLSDEKRAFVNMACRRREGRQPRLQPFYRLTDGA